MIIEMVTNGDYYVNSYVLVCPKTKKAAVVDSGQEARLVLEAVKRNDAELVAILLTHGHMDHIQATGGLKEAYPEAKIYIHQADAEKLTDPSQNLSGHVPGIPPVTAPPADVIIDEGDEIAFGNQLLIVLHTPGHSPGSVSFLRKADDEIEHDVIFDGDLVFADSIGRTDFPGGSYSTLMKSATEKVLSLAPETVVYPGHNNYSTVGNILKYNMFFA